MSAWKNFRRAISPAAVRSALRGPARLGSKGPTIAEVMPKGGRFSALVRYEAFDPNPQNWFAAMQRADYGDTSSMLDIFYDSRDRDSHLDGVARKRAQSLMGRPITFRTEEGLEQDKEALDIARRVRRIVLNDTKFVSSVGVTLGFKSGMTHLASAAVDGYAVASQKWRTNARGEIVPLLEFKHGNEFGFDRDTKRIGFYSGSYRGGHSISPLSEYQDRFVVHVPMNGRSDYPWRRGAMRSCIIPSFIKREGLRFWLTLTERFGMPQPYAKVPKGTDNDGKPSDAIVAETMAALQGLSEHWVAVFGENIDIESIPGSGAVKAEVHKALIDWADTTQSIAMLGQNLSTKVEGGSFAAAESHRYVAGDLQLSDATELAETITQQIVEPIVRYNWPGAPVPVCEIATGQRQAFKTEHVDKGIATPDELRRTLGHEALPEGQGSELRRPTQTPGTPGPEAAPPGPMAPAVTTDEET